jgi:hypothetical protein
MWEAWKAAIFYYQMVKQKPKQNRGIFASIRKAIKSDKVLCKFCGVKELIEHQKSCKFNPKNDFELNYNPLFFKKIAEDCRKEVLNNTFTNMDYSPKSLKVLDKAINKYIRPQHIFNKKITINKHFLDTITK